MEQLAELKAKADSLLNQLLFATTAEAYKGIEKDLKETRIQIGVLEGQDRVRDKAAEEAAMKKRLDEQAARIARVETAKQRLAEIEKKLFADIQIIYADWMKGLSLMQDASIDLANAKDEARDLGLEKPEGFPRTFAFSSDILSDVHNMLMRYVSQAGTLQSAKKHGKPVKMLTPTWETFTEFGSFQVDENGDPIHY